MLSRLSSAMGCPVTTNSGSFDDDIFMEHEPTFPPLSDCLPLQFTALNNALSIMEITSSRDHTNLLFQTSSLKSSRSAATQTAWHVANSARLRVKPLEAKLSSDIKFQSNIIKEMREIISGGSDTDKFNCICLLSPILTKDDFSKDDLVATGGDSEAEDQVDVLVLFGSPASAIQLFLSIPCIRSNLLDTLLEAIANESPHSIAMLSQLFQPVGLRSFYSSITDIDSIVGRLMELFKIINASEVKAHVLSLIPGILMTSVGTSQTDMASTVISNTVTRLVDLFDSICLLPGNDGINENETVTDIIECVSQFQLEGISLSRFKDACRNLIARSTGLPKYLSSVFRCLFTTGISKTFLSDQMPIFISLFRNKVSFQGASNKNIFFLLDTFSLSFQTNRTMAFEWFNYLNNIYSKDVEPSRILDDLVMLAVGYEALSSAQAAGGVVRRELNLVLKTVTSMAEGGIRSLNQTYVLQYAPIFLHDSLFSALMCLIDHIVLASATQNAIQFAFSIYSCVLQCSKVDDGPAKTVVARLCDSVSIISASSFMPGYFGCTLPPKVSALNLLLQLAKQFPAKVALYFDLLLNVVDRVAIRSQIPDLKEIRQLFTVLGFVAFNSGISGSYLQDDLFMLTRRLLLNRSIIRKTIGLIGAITVLEMLCRRQRHERSTPNSNMSQQIECSQSSVLASQIVQLSSQHPGASQDTSRGSSTRSHLSLRGPGTSLADDPEEINQLLEVNEDTDKEVVLSVTSKYLPPPSRIILQLVGLVENSVRQTQLPQMKTLWLDELAGMFARLDQSIRVDTPLSDDAKRTIDWMGSRVMCEFQDEFVMDNMASSGNETQLALNGKDLCEIAISIGPAWSKFTQGETQTRPLMSSEAGAQISRKSGTSGPLSPCLLTGQLHLLAIAEAVRSNGRLDAMNAILGCPLLLPSTPLSEVCPQLLLIAVNCCIESVNIFAGPIALSPRQPGPKLTTKRQSCSQTRSHPLTSTLVCRLAQIAGLRYCMQIGIMALKGRQMPALIMPTVTYEPGYVFSSSAVTGMTSEMRTTLSRHSAYPPSVKSISLCAPSVKKKTSAAKKATKRGIHEVGGFIASSDDTPTQKRKFPVDRDHRLSDNGEEEMKQAVVSTVMDEEHDGSEAECVDINKLSSSGRSNQLDELFNDPLLISFGVCFRELDLSAILIGLQSPLQPVDEFQLPANHLLCDCQVSEAIAMIYDLSHMVHHGPGKSPPIQLDWLTISYLLHELKVKLDYLAGFDLKSVAGWYAFERLNSLSIHLRRSYLLALVSCLVRIIDSLSAYFRDDSLKHKTNNLTEKKDADDDDDASSVCIDLVGSSSSRVLADSLSAGLYCLAALTTDLLPNLTRIRSPEQILSRPPPSTHASVFSRLRCLARLLQGVEMDEVEPKKPTTFIFDRKIPVTSMLDDDVLELSTIGDHDADTNLTDADSGSPTAKEIVVILKWLIDMAPKGLVHASSAFIHCRFVLALSALLHKLPFGEMPLDFPDLVAYTHSLLNVSLDHLAVWQDHRHKECFQALIDMHLLAPSFSITTNSQINDSLTLYLTFIKNNLLPLLYQIPSLDDNLTPTSAFTYSSLNLQTVQIYTRKLLNSICVCSRKLAKQTLAIGRVDLPIDLLTTWNLCVSALVAITEAGKRSENLTSKELRGQSHIFYVLLPSLMRAGRTFLESLLRGAMTFLNAIFKNHSKQVMTFLRNVQQLTRFLQRTCVHAKMNREAKLTTLIPQTRKCLEAFVYGVKLLLSQNKCADAFWLGNLKNRDLNGIEVQDNSTLSTQQDDDDKGDEFGERHIEGNEYNSASENIVTEDESEDNLEQYSDD